MLSFTVSILCHLSEHVNPIEYFSFLGGIFCECEHCDRVFIYVCGFPGSQKVKKLDLKISYRRKGITVHTRFSSFKSIAYNGTPVDTF